jgi:hypothetical protein
MSEYWPYWETFPNRKGRDRGPTYMKEIEGIQFKIEPYWRRAERGGGRSKVRDESGHPLVKDGCVVTSGLPPTRIRGREGHQHFETLKAAKDACELFAREVRDGKRDATGAWL